MAFVLDVSSASSGGCVKLSAHHRFAKHAVKRSVASVAAPSQAMQDPVGSETRLSKEQHLGGKSKKSPEKKMQRAEAAGTNTAGAEALAAAIGAKPEDTKAKKRKEIIEGLGKGL